MKQNNFNLKEVKVYRNTEATVFEIAFAVEAIIVWGLIIWMIYQAPDVVPTHFDASGKPNSYGSPSSIIIPCIILTAGAIMCMAIAYFPHRINMPVKITNIRQVALAIRSTRVMGCTLLLVPLAVVYMMLGMASPSPAPVLPIIGLLILEVIVFTILINKAK